MVPLQELSGLKKTLNLEVEQLREVRIYIDKTAYQFLFYDAHLIRFVCTKTTGI